MKLGKVSAIVAAIVSPMLFIVGMILALLSKNQVLFLGTLALIWFGLLVRVAYYIFKGK